MTQNWGNLTSPSFDLSGTGTAWLHFYTFFDVEINNGPAYDWLDVQVSPDNSAWTPLRSIENGAMPPDPEGVWFRVDVNISAWTGDSTVWIRFHFDTIDGDANAFSGWYVDDVLIDDVPPAVSGAPVPYSEDFDSGSPVGWTWTSYWHHTEDQTSLSPDACMNIAGDPVPPPYVGHPKTSFSSPGSMGYHIDPPNPTGSQDCTYDDGDWNKGWLKSPPIDMSAMSMGYVSFWFWADIENGYELLNVQYSVDDFDYYTLDNLDDYFQGAGTYSYRYGMWNFYSYNLTDSSLPGPAAVGSSMVWFRFHFDTGDSLSNDFAGWYIDDFVVSDIASIQSYYIGTQSPPVADGTYSPGEYLAPSMTNLPFGADHWENLANVSGNEIGNNYLIIENDMQNLYIVYDVVGDATPDAPGADGAQISFDPQNDDLVGGGDLDDEWGFDAFGMAPNPIFHASNGVFADPCGPPAVCGMGFGTSDNEPVIPHRIYEFMIPLSMLGFGTNPSLPWPVTQGYAMGFAGSSGPTGWNPGVIDASDGWDQWPLRPGGAIPQFGFGDLILGVPQVLANDYPLEESPPTDPSLNNPIDMHDLFQFEAGNWDHAVIGMMQSTFGFSDDYGIAAFPNTTFMTQITDSTAGTDITEVIVLDKLTYSSPPNRGVGVGWQAGTTLDNYYIEMETDFDDYNPTDSWTGFMDKKTEGIEVFDAYEIMPTADGLYDISLEMEPLMDLDLFLFDVTAPAPTDGSRTGNPPVASSQTSGPGVGEYLNSVPLSAGIEYLLVVTNEIDELGQYWINPLGVSYTDLAPGTVNQWDVSVEMLALQLDSLTGTTITDIDILDIGSGGPDVSAVTVYDDANDNQMFDPGTDRLQGMNVFSGGSASINFPVPFTVPPSVTENLLVIFNIAPQAVAGNNVGAGVNAVDIVTGDGDPVFMLTPAASSLATINAGTIPTINSDWQATAPTADGTYGAGEHSFTLGWNTFAMEGIAGNGILAYMIAENDATDLYVTYDVVGDITNDVNDRSSFSLDTDNNDAPTLNGDDQFQTTPPDHLEFDGGTWSSVDPCTAPGLVCASGFGPSPNSATPHTIFEYKVPLTEIGVVAGDTMGFWSGNNNWAGVSDDSATFFDYNTWPQFNFMPAPLIEYGNLVLASGPAIDALTVVGADLAPVNVQQGDPDVEMERLTLTAGSGSVTVNSIQVDLGGTEDPADVALVEIWDDVNGNDFVDVGDVLLGSGTFAGGPPPTVTITLGAGFTVTSGTPETLLVVFDIAVGATAGNLVGVDIVDQTYVVVAAPDTVNPFGPLASTDSQIQAAVPDSLTVVGFDLAPATVSPGELDVEMERLTLTAGSGSITVNSIQVDLSGSMVAADVALVEIWDDVNGNDIVDVGDMLLGSGTFAGGPPPTVTIALGGGFVVTSGTPEWLLVVYDIAGAATPANTVGVSIVDETYVVVAAPDTVNAFGPLASTDSVITGGPDALTVVGTDLAPANVMQGDPNVVMERLVLTAGSGLITVNTIQVDLAGSGAAADIALVEIWDDVNGNDVVDVGDVLLGSGTFAGGPPPTVTITLGAGYLVTAGTPETLLVVYDIAVGATAGNTVGVSIVDQTYVVVAAPDTVNAFGPLASTNSLIQAAVPDSLTVAGADLAPANVNPGQLDVIMERLTLTAGTGTVTVNSIQVDLSGTGVAADITSVQIWDDVNGNDNIDGPDVLLGSGVFAGGPPPTVTIMLGGGYTVTSGTPETLLIVFDIAVGATPGNTVGARVVNQAYVSVVAPDTVNAFGPLQSTNSLIQALADTLRVTGTGLTQLTAYPGETDVVLTGMRLSALSGSVTVTDIDIFAYGSATDADVAQALLYDDTDDSSTINVGDTLLDTATLVNGRATFSGFSFTVTSGTDEHLMIAFNISSTATIGNIFAMVIMSNQNITVNAPDTVSMMNFPLGTQFVEIIGGTITGTVEDEGGNPIAGANVQLINSTGVIVDVVATNSTGGFMFGDAYFGTYTLNASATDYEHNDSATATISLGTPSDSAGTIALAAVTTGVPPATEGDIEGNVYDKDGEPIAGVKVELLDDQGNVVETATTNAQGHYSFDGLAFDTYSVRMSGSGLLNQTSDEFTLDANSPSMDFVNTMTAAPTTPEGEEVVPIWAWLLIVLFLILFVVFLLLWLMGRKKGPEVVAPPKPLPPEMVEAEGAMAPLPVEAPGEPPAPTEPGAPPEPTTPPEPETEPDLPPPPPPA
jgi:hypothetical protein